jgi:hypothetical protein
VGITDKFQIPSTKFQTNSKRQKANKKKNEQGRFEFGFWCFGFVWSLEFGAWCLVPATAGKLWCFWQRQPPVFT